MLGANIQFINNDMDFIDPQVIRTDFRNESKWNQLCEEVNILNSEVGVQADVHFINDSELRGLNHKDLLCQLSGKYLNEFDFFFVADEVTFNHKELPLLCVKIPCEYSPQQDSFRVVPSEMWSVEKNLRIANMDFEEFSQEVDSDGIHRGF